MTTPIDQELKDDELRFEVTAYLPQRTVMLSPYAFDRIHKLIKERNELKFERERMAGVVDAQQRIIDLYDRHAECGAIEFSDESSEELFDLKEALEKLRGMRNDFKPKE